MEQQLTLNFDPSIVDQFDSCREFIDDHSRRIGKQRKWIAMEMDLAPSLLSRKLNPGCGDTTKFTLDDAELYTQRTGDTSWIAYLVAKYYVDDRERKIEELKAQIAELEKTA